MNEPRKPARYQPKPTDAYAHFLPTQYKEYCVAKGIPADSALVLWDQSETVRDYVAMELQRSIAHHGGNDLFDPLSRLYKRIVGKSVWSWENE